MFYPNLFCLFRTVGEVRDVDACWQVAGTRPPTYDSFMPFNSEENQS